MVPSGDVLHDLVPQLLEPWRRSRSLASRTTKEHVIAARDAFRGAVPASARAQRETQSIRLPADRRG